MVQIAAKRKQLLLKILPESSEQFILSAMPEQLKNKYLSSISNKWDLLRSTGKLRIIEKGIEKTSWQEIKGYLLDNN